METTLQWTCILIIFRDKAADFCAEIESEEGCPAWIIGSVVEGNHEASIVDSPTFIEV